MRTFKLSFAIFTFVSIFTFLYSPLYGQNGSWHKTKFYSGLNDKKAAAIYYHDKIKVSGDIVTLQVKYELTEYGKAHYAELNFPSSDAISYETLNINTKNYRYCTTCVFYEFPDGTTRMRLETPNNRKWVAATPGDIDYRLAELAKQLAGK